MSRRKHQPLSLDQLRTGLPGDVESCHELIYELLAHVHSLQDRLVAVEEKQGTSSRNSSKPPSSDSPEQRSQRDKKPKSGRKRGAQAGHANHQRTLLDESAIPDGHIHRHYPDSRCPCGGLRLMLPLPALRHQVFDLPVVHYDVDEHQVFEAVCPCCDKKARGALPPGIPRGQMGPGLISFITLMNGAYTQSIRSIQRLLQAQWQLDFSIGAISQATRPVSAWLAPLYFQAFEAVRAEPVVHADETLHYRRQDKFWLWVMCSPSVAVFMTHLSRGKGAANELLGDFNGILVTDQHGGYNDHEAFMRQLCWSHLTRKFKKMAGRVGKAGRIGLRLLRLSQWMIHFHNRWLKGHYSDECYRRRMTRFRAEFHQTLKQGAKLRQALNPEKPSVTANQCKRLLEDEIMLWTFLRKPRVIPLTNNTAERAIRPYVIWRKMSFASQSLRGDQFRPIILTVVETCKRLGVDAYRLLRKVCTQGMQGLEITERLPIPKTEMKSLPHLA